MKLILSRATDPVSGVIHEKFRPVIDDKRSWNECDAITRELICLGHLDVQCHVAKVLTRPVVATSDESANPEQIDPFDLADPTG